MAAVNLNAQQLKQMMNEGKIVLVDYWAPWCGYCRRITTPYDRIADQYGDRVHITKINIDEEPLIAHKEHIEVITKIVLYHHGEAIGSMVAPESKAAIDAFLSEKLGI